MPAAAVTAPSPATSAANPPSPVAPGSGDAFGQVLQSVHDATRAASSQAPVAPTTDPSKPPAPPESAQASAPPNPADPSALNQLAEDPGISHLGVRDLATADRPALSPATKDPAPLDQATQTAPDPAIPAAAPIQDSAANAQVVAAAAAAAAAARPGPGDGSQAAEPAAPATVAPKTVTQPGQDTAPSKPGRSRPVASQDAMPAPDALPAPGLQPPVPEPAPVTGRHGETVPPPSQGKRQTGSDRAIKGLQATGEAADAAPSVQPPSAASLVPQPVPSLAPASAPDSGPDQAPSKSLPLGVLQASAANASVAQPEAADRKTPFHVTEAAASPAQPTFDAALPAEPLVGSLAPPTLPAEAAVAAPPRVHTTTQAAPAEQLAPALLTLAKSPDGSHEMTVRLHPDELGVVQIRIAKAASGLTHIDVTAEKSDTLLILQRDQVQLHRTLDEAGIPAAGRTVAFHAASQTSATGTGSSQTGGQPGNPARTAGGMDADGSTGGGGKGSYPSREQNSYSNARRPAGSAEAAAANVAAAAKIYRIGLDITA